MPARRAAAAAAARPLLPPRPRQPVRGRYLRIIFLFISVSLLYVLFRSSSKASSNQPVGPAPKPVEGQFVRRIVAVGDLHGDYNNAFKVLHMANVVDTNGSWTGNIDYLVQTGDIIDRGDDTIKIFRWMETLREQARNAGGAVFSHLGNHELMNALGDWRYVHQSEIATFGSVAKRQAALSTGFIGAAWARNYSVASRVPLHPSSGSPFADYTPSAASNALSHASLSFMHGGLSPTFSNASPYPSKINALGAKLLRRCQTRNPQPAPHPPAPYAGLPPGSTNEEAEMYGEDGPVWYRGWAMDGESAVCSKVGAVTEKIGVRRLIMGHTPNFEKIVSRCGGKIIIIDTGISKAYGGALSALSITYTLTPILSSFDVSSPTSLPTVDAQHTFRGFEPASHSSGDVDTDQEGPGPSSNVEHTEGDKGSGRRGRGMWIEREEIVALYPDRREELVVDERQVEGNFW